MKKNDAAEKAKVKAGEAKQSAEFARKVLSKVVADKDIADHMVADA